MYPKKHSYRSFLAIVGSLIAIALIGLALLQSSPAVVSAEAPRAVSIAWAEKPQDLQLYPRNLTSNQATVTLAGTVQTPDIDQMRVKVTRDGVAYEQQDAALTYAGDSAYFSFDVLISAETSNYDFEIYSVVGASETFEERINDVVAGDVIIIQGQSNAVAQPYDADGNGSLTDDELADPSENHYFVRSFGTATTDPWQVGSNLEWHVAIADGNNSVATIGQWGLRMGNQLVETHDVPLAIINGGQGNSAIKIFQRRESDHSDNIANYARLDYRLNAAGIADAPRAIVWYQGESDIDNADSHETGFDRLYSDWAEDYPSVEHLYVVQLRDGCFGSNIELRSRQRDLADRYDNIQVIASNGIAGHRWDCHYNWVDGYRTLGDWLFRPISRDLFDGAASNDIDSPNIERAYFSNAAQTEITMPLRDKDDSVTWQSDGSGSALSGFQIVGDSGLYFTSGRVDGSDLILTINRAPANAIGISYHGQYAYAGQSGTAYWITNANGMGLLSFYNEPVLADTFHPQAAFEWTNDGASVTFDASGSADYDGSITGYSWDFGDGSSVSSATPSVAHTFAANASFDVTLTVTDNNGNQHAVTQTILTPYDTEAACSINGLTYQRFDNISGHTLADLTGSSNYPDSPDLDSALTQFELVSNFGENYGARMRAFIVAPYTGEYQFWLSSDDHGIVYLSTDADPANITQLVLNESYTYPRYWESSSEPWVASAQSDMVSLVAGQRYYIEALYKEGSGGDHFSLAWKTPQAFDFELLDYTALCVFDETVQVDPVAMISADSLTGPAPLTVNFDASGSTDLDGSITSYAWSFGDYQTDSGMLNAHTFGSPGIYETTLTVTDNAGNESTATVQVTVETPSCDGGGLLYERWNDVSGESISDITNNADYPNSPDVSQIIDNAEIESPGTDNYAVRMRGQLIPPTSGTYKFRIASDDASQMLLTMNGSQQEIVSVAGWVTNRQWMEQWVWNASQESAEITLTGGQSYPLEIFFKEAWGSDHLSIAWMQPGTDYYALINCSSLQPTTTTVPTSVTLAPAQTDGADAPSGMLLTVILLWGITLTAVKSRTSRR